MAKYRHTLHIWRCRGPGGSHRLQNGWGVARRGPWWVRLPYASAKYSQIIREPHYTPVVWRVRSRRERPPHWPAPPATVVGPADHRNLSTSRGPWRTASVGSAPGAVLGEGMVESTRTATRPVRPISWPRSGPSTAHSAWLRRWSMC